MKKILLLMMAVAMVAMSSSASTKIYVCGTKITGSTSFSAGGGTVTFDASSYTLTISNVYYLVSGDNNNGISVDNLDQTLKINFEGYNTFGTGDTDAALFKSAGKTIWLTINGNTTFYSADSGHAGLKIQDCFVEVKGPGKLTIKNTSSSNSASAVKGGSGNEELYMHIKECEIESRGSRINKLKKLIISGSDYNYTGDYSAMTTKVTLKAGVNSNAPVKDVNEISTQLHIFQPIDYIDYYAKDYLGSAGLSQTDVVLTNYTPAVIITPYRFPDTNLYNYMKNLVPKRYLTASERDTYTSMNISGKNISSIEGLAQFSKLKVLNFSNNNVTSTPLGNGRGIPTTVETLYCYNNNLTILYLGGCENLFYLDCSNNQLTRSDFLPYLTSTVLETLNCSNNKLDGECNFTWRKKLRKLDFSNNPNATKLICNGLQLTELNVSGCTSLNEINCSNNQLTSLNNIPTSVQTLNCSSNKFSGTFTLTNRSNLKTLDINSNPSITTLNCYSNALTSLNVQSCSALTTLQCYSNKLTSLNLTGCSALTYLSCHNNQITSFTSLPTTLQTIYCNDNKLSGGTFDVSGRSALKTLNISNNPNFSGLKCNNCSLTSLNVSGCTGLTTLICYSNQLTSLNLSGCTNLTNINCQYNKITSLNLSPCTSLKSLYCYDNELTSISNIPNSIELIACENNKFSTLEIIGKSKLWGLRCYNNPNLTSLKAYNNSALYLLNVSNCPSLTTLQCYNNKLSVQATSATQAANGGLYFAGSTAIKNFICNNNQLTSLDVSSLSNLTELNCSWNKLSSLNVSNKTKLTQLQAHYNQLTSLNVQGCSSLNYLMLESNKFTSLSVQGCNALRTINCCLNKISASGANTLINSLCTIPSGSQGALRYIYPGYSSGSYVENNVNLTDAQVRSARNKRWTPYKFVSGTGWVEIPVNTAVPGDVNGDGTVTAADITALYDVLLNNDYSQIVNGDQTGDSIITAADITAVYTIMLSSKK